MIALLLAERGPLLSGDSFMHDFQITPWIVGALLLLMGAMGTRLDLRPPHGLGVTGHAWGASPASSTLELQRRGPTLTAGAVFVLSGVVAARVRLFVL